MDMDDFKWIKISKKQNNMYWFLFYLSKAFSHELPMNKLK